MFKVLTIAGSDSSGGAGIQADLKTICAHKMYGMSAITALTAQNTLGVTDIMNVTPNFLKNELDAIFTDIYPDSVKIGMVSDKDLIKTISNSLKKYNDKNNVLDPVMVSTSGSKLLSDDAINALIEELFPIADVITPNILEAEALTGIKINNSDDMLKAGLELKKITKNVLVKGGHSINDANDLLITDDGYYWINGKRINNPNTHGTGCTLSSAIACELTHHSLYESIVRAKNYISKALEGNLDLGHGSGPLDHMFNLEDNYEFD